MDHEPDECWEAGYPTEAFLSWLKTTKHHLRALGLVSQYFEDCGYGTVQTTNKDDNIFGPIQRVGLSTGGWSGCEDVISALEANVEFWICHWYSLHRGGHFVFASECAFHGKT